MSRRFDVYGIGNAIMDLQLQISDADLTQLNIPKGGMVLVDTAAQKRILEFFHGRDVNQASGGSAANTMIALAQLGRNVGYGCVVAEDDFGQFYLSEMEQLGVELHNAARAGESTGSSVILITPDAERTMNTCLAATANFGPEHVSETHLKDSEWLYVEGYLFASEPGRAAVEKALRIAKENNVKVAVTFSDTFIVGVFREPLQAAVEQADLIFANLTEGGAYTGETDEAKIVAALKKAVPSFALTRGERGAYVYCNGESVEVPGYPVTAVDETGAGDMFAGGFLNGLATGQTVEETAKIACFLASKVVSKLGPRLEECDIAKFEAGVDMLPA